MSHVGSRIRELRKEAGLTQRELARMLGVTPSYISKLESGAEEPGSSLIGFISLLFHVRLEWLQSGQEPRARDLHEVLEHIVDRYGLAAVRSALTRLALEVKEGPATDPDAPLVRMIEQLSEMWRRAGDKERIWMEVQFQRAFPDTNELS
ncbi:MAG TPA: helix-turn-helix transcriptional regulator [Limnochordia bacterium]